MRYDPITDYRRAIAVMIDWECTAAITGSLAHHGIAATCQQIALERARCALATSLSDAERALLRVIELEAMTQTRIETSRAAIARTLALLEASEPAASGPAVLTWIPSQAAE